MEAAKRGEQGVVDTLLTRPGIDINYQDQVRCGCFNMYVVSFV